MSLDKADKLKLSKNAKIEMLKMIHRASKMKLAKGRSSDVLSAAIIYLASKKAKEAISAKKISREYRISNVEIVRCAKTIAKKMSEKIEHSQPGDYIPIPSRILKLPKKVVDDAIKVAKEFKGEGSPVGKAAAALYISMLRHDMKISKEKLANIVGVSTTTLNKRLKEKKRGKVI